RYLTSLMTSSTGWRDTARMSANRAFVPKPWPLSRIARRISPLLRRGLKGGERFVVLPAGLADCSAHHHLENLGLAKAGCTRRAEVLICDLVGVLGDLVDQRVQRLGKPCVVERGTALGARRLAVSFEDPRDQRLARLRNIRHAMLPPTPQPRGRTTRGDDQSSHFVPCRSGFKPAIRRKRKRRSGSVHA